MIYDYSILKYGEHAVLITWQPVISEKVHTQVMRMERYLRYRYSEDIREVVSTYHALLIHLQLEIDLEGFIASLNVIELTKIKELSYTSSTYEIPVLYDSTVGPDLEELSLQKNFSIEQLIDLHTQPTYTVYFIGFLPGFPYLGGLVKQLHTPRKKDPRSRVEAGSIAIGGRQTGIYPQASPGGWNIIGRTPVSLFQPGREEPFLLKSGDRVRFSPIDRERFDEICEQIRSDKYIITKEQYHG